MAEGGGAPPAEAMRKGKGVSGVIAIVVAIITFLAGLGVGAVFLAPAPPTAAPKLLLGTNTPFPPFEYYDQQERLVGFDVELIQTLVTRAGYSYEWRDFTDFTALLLAVSASGVDIAIGAITIRADRNASLDFTNPYYESDQGILKLTSDTANYCAAADCTVAELNRTDLVIGAQEITTSEFWVEDNLPAVVDSNNLKLFPGVTQVLQALTAGSVDIVVIDKPAADGIAAGNTAFTVAGTIQTNELYGFAVANTDPDGLIPKLNAQLAAIRADGTYATLLDKYF
jgi:polar amino acid transport system substrate-binding protein